jgi:hypothetical protein
VKQSLGQGVWQTAQCEGHARNGKLGDMKNPKRTGQPTIPKSNASACCFKRAICTSAGPPAFLYIDPPGATESRRSRSEAIVQHFRGDAPEGGNEVAASSVCVQHLALRSPAMSELDPKIISSWKSHSPFRPQKAPRLFRKLSGPFSPKRPVKSDSRGVLHLSSQPPA